MGTSDVSRARRRVAAVLVGAVTAGALVAVAPAPPVGAAPLPSAIATVAGGALSGGSPLTTAVNPAGLARNGSVVLIADTANSVVRTYDEISGTVGVLAGTGVPGSSGDGGLATAATLRAPYGVAVDGAGVVYITDIGNHNVRRVGTDGVITTVAGTGQPGFSGDGGPAAAAELNFPAAVAVDTAGRLLIADSFNNRVRRVAPDSTISTIAGTGDDWFGGDGGPATSATISFPSGLAVRPSGEILVSDTRNHRVRSIDGVGVITTVVGNGAQGFAGDGGDPVDAQLDTPTWIAADGADAVVVADTGNRRVRRATLTGTPDITTVAGSGTAGFSGDGGPATSASLSTVGGLAVSGATLYLADAEPRTPRTAITAFPELAGNNRVRRVAAGVIGTVVGNGTRGTSGDGAAATAAQVAATGVATDAKGNTFVVGEGRVRRIAPTGTVTTVAGGGAAVPANGPDATAVDLGAATAVAATADGTVFVNGTYDDGVTTSFVARIGTDGAITVIATLPHNGALGMLETISGIAAVGPSEVYLLEAGWQAGFESNPVAVRILRWNGSTTSTVVDVFDVDNDWMTFMPQGLAVKGSTFLLASPWDDTVLTVDAAGTFAVLAGGGAGGDGGPASTAKLRAPSDVAVDLAGNVVIAEAGGHRIRRVDASSTTISTVAGTGTAGFSGDGGPPTAATLQGPAGVTVDAAGRIVIADELNHRVRRVGRPDPAGTGFHAVTPYRALDSRTGVGGWASTKLGPGQVRNLTLAGVGPVPAAATAVVMNITVTGGTQPSYLQAFPAGADRPLTANVLFGPGQTVPNAATVALGSGGAAAFFNEKGAVHVVVDVVGYFDDGTGDGDLFTGVTPTRLLDSRSATGGWPGALGAGQTRDLAVRGVAPVAADATAVVLNVSVTGGTAASYLQAFPSGSSPGATANLLFGAGQTVPNLVTVGVGTNGAVSFFNQKGAVHVVADVMGYFAPGPAGSKFHPITPARVLDSRTATGGFGGPVAAGSAKTLPVGGFPTIPADATGLVANVTVTGGTAASYLSVAPTPGPVPAPTANLLFAKGQTVPNLVVVSLPAAGSVDIFNQHGSVHVILDAAGYFAPA